MAAVGLTCLRDEWRAAVCAICGLGCGGHFETWCARLLALGLEVEADASGARASSRATQKTLVVGRHLNDFRRIFFGDFDQCKPSDTDEHERENDWYPQRPGKFLFW